MAKLSLLFVLNAYSDKKGSNAPNLNNFRWTRDIQGVEAESPLSQEVTLAASETKTLFTGSAVKKFVYIEANKACDLVINGDEEADIKPFVINDSTQPGIFVRTSDITSIEVTNPSSTEELTVFFVAVE